MPLSSTIAVSDRALLGSTLTSYCLQMFSLGRAICLLPPAADRAFGPATYTLLPSGVFESITAGSSYQRTAVCRTFPNERLQALTAVVPHFINQERHKVVRRNSYLARLSSRLPLGDRERTRYYQQTLIEQLVPMSDGMHSFATTYSQRKARVAAILSAKGVSQQQVMNCTSALNGWMRRLGLADDSVRTCQFGTAGDQAKFLCR